MKGQIIKIVSNLCFVKNGKKIYECHPRGKFRNQNIAPIVGDYVKFDEEHQYILEILPRKNELLRPFVSNIDQGIIVTSAKQPDFSTNLLDKLITTLEHHHITPIICLTKLDLLSNQEKKQLKKIMRYYENIGYQVFKNTDKRKIKKIFKNKTTVFTGQTGAGKSTLLNHLDKSLNLATGEISKALGRGRHTTRHVELLEIAKGKVVDTPGFSSIDFNDMSMEEIKDTFIEFRKYPCPYQDCSHLNEKECQVKSKVKEGKILSSRYENYCKFITKSR
ncbi:MAG: ribosome small subunit-dependent GTPase A [bacterium]|nr:ribosome small subunit-dependent GTPase A [bacterium]